MSEIDKAIEALEKIVRVPDADNSADWMGVVGEMVTIARAALAALERLGELERAVVEWKEAADDFNAAVDSRDPDAADRESDRYAAATDALRAAASRAAVAEGRE